VLLALAVTRDIELPSITADISGSSASPADREALLRYFDEFRIANFHHLLASSPSGWLAWCLLTTRRIVAKIFSRQLDDNPPLRKQVVRVELKAIPELTPLPEAPVRRGPLLDEPALVA
jgi:hypothetical protein